MMGARMLTDEQMGELLASQARCERSHKATTEELSAVRLTLDATLSEVERIGRAQDQAEARRRRVSERVGALESRQAQDDNERTEREGGRKMARVVAKVLGPILALIVLPAAGWGASWLAEDYSGQRDVVEHVAREVAMVKDLGSRERRRLDQAESRGRRNTEALRTLEGRLGGLQSGQEEILSALRGRRR